MEVDNKRMMIDEAEANVLYLALKDRLAKQWDMNKPEDWDAVVFMRSLQERLSDYLDGMLMWTSPPKPIRPKQPPTALNTSNVKALCGTTEKARHLVLSPPNEPGQCCVSSDQPSPAFLCGPSPLTDRQLVSQNDVAIIQDSKPSQNVTWELRAMPRDVAQIKQILGIQRKQLDEGRIRAKKLQVLQDLLSTLEVVNDLFSELRSREFARSEASSPEKLHDVLIKLSQAETNVRSVVEELI